MQGTETAHGVRRSCLQEVLSHFRNRMKLKQNLSHENLQLLELASCLQQIQLHCAKDTVR